MVYVVTGLRPRFVHAVSDRGSRARCLYCSANLKGAVIVDDLRASGYKACSISLLYVYEHVYLPRADRMLREWLRAHGDIFRIT